jgi:hypothetical protein
MQAKAMRKALSISISSARVAQFAGSPMATARRLDFRRPCRHSTRGRKRLIGRKNSDDEGIAVGSFAWA